jgi:hypothetical protein
MRDEFATYEPALRLQALEGGPLRGGESYQFGFYDAGVMRETITNYGGGFRVTTLPIPQSQEEFLEAQRIISDPTVQYALVDKNKLVVVYVDNSPGWMSAIDALGYEVMSGDKTNKRLKSFHRPTLLNMHFEPDELNIVYVEDDEFSRYDFSEDGNVAYRFQDPEIVERLLDGGFVISRRIVQRAVQNLPVFEPENSTDSQDYYYDPRIRQQLVHDLLQAGVLNARIIFKDGFLKGNCLVVDLPEDVDVLTARSNVKKEIRYNKGFRFLAEPQGPKSRVITDDQTVINFPKLFRKSDMEMWLKEEYKKMYDRAISGDLLTNWKYIYQRIWHDNRDINENEARARMAYVGYRWTAAGFSITNSPWLFETVATSHAAPLKQRIPIPCAVYEQIVPESLVRMAGYDIAVEEETIIRINELGVHVVNDLDWLEMYESHGGHDQDDFFKLFYRTMEGGDYDGEKVVIAIRSPNGYGEYTIFKYVENAWNPKWHKADGTEVTFPAVNGVRWPKRLSDAIHSGEVTYTGLPSDSRNKVQRSGPYTIADVFRDITIAMAGGNVGGFVNAAMAHASAIAKHNPTQLCSLETAIDKCINPDDADDVVAIDREARNMIRQIIESGKPVDEVVFTKRIPRRYLKPGEEINTYQGKITQIQKLCTQHYDEYVHKISTWAQLNSRPPEIVHEIGKRMYYRTLAHLRDFRKGLFNTNSSEESAISGGIERNSWEDMYQSVVELINSYERYQDRFDFVLGLYSATINVPTSAGKITDQIVMNRFVYPYLEAALQYYGIANITMYDNRDGKMKIATIRNDEWFWPDADGNLVRYDNALDFQNAHAKDSPVVWTMPKAPEGRLTKSIF